MDGNMGFATISSRSRALNFDGRYGLDLMHEWNK